MKRPVTSPSSTVGDLEDEPAAPGDDGRSGAPGDLDFGMLPRLLARQLRIAQLAVFKNFSLEYDGASLSPGSFEILELLTLNPGIGPSRLGHAIGLEKSSMVPALARLEDLALIERRPSPTDKRATELRTTPKGRKALLQFRRFLVERDKHVTRGMSAADVALLNALLARLASINA